MAEITDPNILSQFNAAPSAVAQPKGLVTDPEILKHFDLPPSTTEDVLRSGGSGLAKGLVAGAGSAGDLRETASVAADVAGKALGVSHETVQSLKDKASAVAPYLPGPLGLAGSMFANAPTSSDVSHFVGDSDQGRNAAGQVLDYKPQTTAGRYTEKAGEFVGNPLTYVGPGGVVGKVATAAGAGVGSEAAGDLADKFFPNSPKAKALLQFLGGVGGGSGVAVSPRLITPNIISPTRQAMIDVLDRERIPLTAGDRTGGTTLKAAESELSPGVNEAQKHAFEQAAFNRVGEQIGERPLHGQNGAVNTMMNRIGGQFDAVANRNQVRADPQLVQDLHTIDTTYNAAPNTPSIYPQETVNAVNGALARVRNSINNGNGILAGPDYQTLRSNLRAAAQGATDPQRSEALHSVTNALDDAMERTIQATNPADAGVFPQIRRAYRNALVLQNWAGAANQTPATLAQAAKSVYGKAQYVRGQDDFSDLAQAGREVLKQYQDSGTARRLQIENVLRGIGGLVGAGLGAAHGDVPSAAEGGVFGLLMGELAGPLAARPAARAALMNPATQGLLSNQIAPYRVGTSPSTIALLNQIRGGGDQSKPPLVPGARQAKDGKWYLPDPSRPGKFLEARP